MPEQPLPELILAYRQSHNLSQVEFGAWVGRELHRPAYVESTVHRWETGKVSPAVREFIRYLISPKKEQRA
jgi:DNA-binding transcriptional regulator YiaG